MNSTPSTVAEVEAQYKTVITFEEKLRRFGVRHTNPKRNDQELTPSALHAQTALSALGFDFSKPILQEDDDNNEDVKPKATSSYQSSKETTITIKAEVSPAAAVLFLNEMDRYDSATPGFNHKAEDYRKSRDEVLLDLGRTDGQLNRHQKFKFREKMQKHSFLYYRWKITVAILDLDGNEISKTNSMTHLTLDKWSRKAVKEKIEKAVKKSGNATLAWVDSTANTEVAEAEAEATDSPNREQSAETNAAT